MYIYSYRDYFFLLKILLLVIYSFFTWCRVSGRALHDSIRREHVKAQIPPPAKSTPAAYRKSGKNLPKKIYIPYIRFTIRFGQIWGNSSPKIYSRRRHGISLYRGSYFIISKIRFARPLVFLVTFCYFIFVGVLDIGTSSVGAYDVEGGKRISNCKQIFDLIDPPPQN